MRFVIKNLLFYMMLLFFFPFHISYLFFGLFVGLDNVFRSYSQALSMIPGMIGVKFRAVFYYLTLEQCSKEVTIEFGTFFVWRGCRLGKNVYIGARCIISYADIGDDTLMGSHINILSGKEQHTATDINVPIRLQGGKKTKITIGQDCWIGNGAMILANVEDKSIVAAGSVVVKDVAKFSIVGGNPAKTIKMRV